MVRMKKVDFIMDKHRLLRQEHDCTETLRARARVGLYTKLFLPDVSVIRHWCEFRLQSGLDLFRVPFQFIFEKRIFTGYSRSQVYKWAASEISNRGREQSRYFVHFGLIPYLVQAAVAPVGCRQRTCYPNRCSRYMSKVSIAGFILQIERRAPDVLFRVW